MNLMTHEEIVRYAALAFLFLLWTALDCFGIKPDPELIATIKAAIFGLGLFHMTMATPPKSP